MLAITATLVGLCQKRTILERFEQIRRGLTAFGRRLPRSYQGWIGQLARMGVAPLAEGLALLRPQIVRRCGPNWTVGPWVPMAVDGSRFDLPHSSSHFRRYGTAGRAGSRPQMWVTVLTHLPTGLLWNWRQGPGGASERSHLREMLDSLPPQALLVGDAGFFSYDLAGELCRRRQPFLLRVAANKRLLQDRRRSGDIEQVYAWPQVAQRDGRPPLRLRLVTVGSGARRVWLLTNVWDPHQLPRRLAGRMYQLRWGVEVTYRHLKQTMDRRKLRCTRADWAAVELAGNLLGLATLVLMDPRLGQSERLCVAEALRVIDRALDGLAWQIVWAEFDARLAQARGDRYRRAGPKNDGTYPQKKTDSPPGPPHVMPLTDKQRRTMRAHL